MYQDKNNSGTAFISRANSSALNKQKRESQQIDMCLQNNTSILQICRKCSVCDDTATIPRVAYKRTVRPLPKAHDRGSSN